MTKRKNAAGLMLLMLCALVVLVGAGDDDDKGWTRLDEADTSHANAAALNKSEFTVKDKDQGYTKIRVRNHGPTVRFTEVDILYSNDEVQKVEMDRAAETNEGTGPIDLKGKVREIKKVVAVYKIVGHHRATGKLTLWGFNQP
jgi:hypothetical protein